MIPIAAKGRARLADRVGVSSMARRLRPGSVGAQSEGDAYDARAICVLKKKVDAGSSGGLTLAQGTTGRTDVGGNVGYQRGALTIFGSYGLLNDRRSRTQSRPRCATRSASTMRWRVSCSSARDASRAPATCSIVISMRCSNSPGDAIAAATASTTKATSYRLSTATHC